MLVATGPTGNVGAEVAALLAEGAADVPYRLAAHSLEKVKRRLGEEVPVVPFDYDDRSTWEAVLYRVDTLFLLFPLPSPRTVNTRMKPFIDAALAAGAQHIIYISVPGSDRQRIVPHYHVEKHIKESGAAYTILRPTYFMQNLCRAVSTHGVDIVEYGEIFIPAGEGKTTFVDARDVALVVIDVVNNAEKHKYKEFILTGPETLNFYEVAEIFSDVMERPIRYSNPSLFSFWRRLFRRGVPWDVVLFMTIVYTLTRRGKNELETERLPELLGHPPRTMRHFVKDYLRRWENRDWT